MCENIDQNVGRVLQRLDSLGLADNTIVVYFSDNGPNTARWNGGMKGRKGSVDEGGLRSPLFIRWPLKLPTGLVVREIAGAIDLLPTLASLAAIERVGDKPLDGRDLTPLLMGENRQWSERMIFGHQNGNVSARSQRYRLDARGALFDMDSDPGQTRDIATERPEIAAKHLTAVNAWRADVLGKRGADDRPYPVGYPEFPRTPLPARDGVASGGIKRSASAPNSSYFVNWTRLEDAMTWDVEVANSGNYAVEILYTCPEADAGSTVQLSFGDNKLEGKVTPGWDPPLYTNQDTITRPAAESKMKEFHSLNLGTIRLEKGRGSLTLKALEIPGKSVMDVRAVNLTLQR